MREIDIHRLIEQQEPEAKQRILKKVYELMPDLAPAQTDDEGDTNKRRKTKRNKKIKKR